MMIHTIKTNCRQLIFIQEAMKARIAWYDDEELWDDNFKKGDMVQLLHRLEENEE